MALNTSDWAPIVPGAGELKETAKVLLLIAGDPALVRTDGNGTEFRVPQWVADAFTAPAEPKKQRAPRRKTEE